MPNHATDEGKFQRLIGPVRLALNTGSPYNRAQSKGLSRPTPEERGMRISVYDRRLDWLDRLPACFTLAEFRAASRLSPDAAWQTLRQWEQGGKLAAAGSGLYLKPGTTLRWPPAVHRAAAGGGYFTGWGALQMLRRRRAALDYLDLVSSRRGADRPARGEIPVRRHGLKLGGFSGGLLRVADGGREIRLALPERVILDSLTWPGRFMGIAEVVALLAMKRPRVDALALLELAARWGCEAVRRRLVVTAAAAGRTRLSRWAGELGPFSPGMGRIRLDPSAPIPRGAPVVSGVILNTRLDG
jgi:hypothetical protein